MGITTLDHGFGSIKFLTIYFPSILITGTSDQENIDTSVLFQRCLLFHIISEHDCKGLYFDPLPRVFGWYPQLATMTEDDARIVESPR